MNPPTAIGATVEQAPVRRRQGVVRGSDRSWLAGVVVLHLLLVIPLAAVLNIWIDEAYTLQSTGGGVLHAIDRAFHFELQPPLYFVLLALWRSIDGSAFFARAFSIACTAGTVIVAEGVARRYLPRVRPALVAAVVACNPLVVYAAVEVRFYALALLLSALLLLFFHDGYLAQGSKRAARWRHAITAVASLYTYYFLGFLLAGGAVALLALRRWRELRVYVTEMLGVGVLFLPLAVVTLQQMHAVRTAGTSGDRRLTFGSRLVWQAMWQHLLPVQPETFAASVRAWVSRLAIPLAMLAAFVRRRVPGPLALAAFAIAIVAFAFQTVVAATLGPEFALLRHAVVLCVPVVLAFLLLLELAGGPRLAMAGAVLGIALSVLNLVATYAPLAKEGDWIRVSDYIASRAGPSEPILLFRGEFVLDFGYHYHGVNLIIPLPRARSRDRYDPSEEVLRDEGDVLRALSGRLGPSRRFWLVTRFTKPFRGVDVHPEILERFVHDRCSIVLDKSFFASRVRLLELKEHPSGERVTPLGAAPAQSPAATGNGGTAGAQMDRAEVEPGGAPAQDASGGERRPR